MINQTLRIRARSILGTRPLQLICVSANALDVSVFLIVRPRESLTKVKNVLCFRNRRETVVRRHRPTEARIPYVRMRHADAACGMRRQMATVGTQRSDFIYADAGAVFGADTDAANRIGPCSHSKRIRTRIGHEIPRSDVITDAYSQLKNMAGRY